MALRLSSLEIYFDKYVYFHISLTHLIECFHDFK